MERFSVSAPGDDRLHIAAGADGRLWFTNGTSVGTLSDSEHEAYPIPGAVDSINAIAQGPGGRIWIAGNAHAGSAPFLASIEHGIWTRYDAKVDSDTMIAGEHVMWAAGSYSEPQAIDQHGAQSASILPRGFDAKIFAVDRQDRVWFTDRYGDVIASEMPRETPAIRYTDFGPPGISDMAFDRDGRLWIAEPKNNAIEVLDRAIYPFSPLIHPTYLLAASNGDVWYSDPQNALIGRIPKKGSGHCYAFKRVHLSCLVVPAAHVR
jgi:streptogramin lyase